MQHNKFQASLSQMVLKKIFEYFSMYFYGLNLGPPAAGLSWNLGPSFEPCFGAILEPGIFILTNLVKDH